jgi:hypothetical protein
VPKTSKNTFNSLTTVADLSAARAGAATNIVLNRLETKIEQEGATPSVNCLLLCERDDSIESSLFVVNNRLFYENGIVQLDWKAAQHESRSTVAVYNNWFQHVHGPRGLEGTRGLEGAREAIVVFRQTGEHRTPCARLFANNNIHKCLEEGS